MNILPLELSLEQQFNLKKYEHQVTDLSRKQAQDFLVEAFQQLMIKDNAIRLLMKSEFGL